MSQDFNSRHVYTVGDRVVFRARVRDEEGREVVEERVGVVKNAVHETLPPSLGGGVVRTKRVQLDNGRWYVTLFSDDAGKPYIRPAIAGEDY